VTEKKGVKTDYENLVHAHFYANIFGSGTALFSIGKRPPPGEYQPISFKGKNMKKEKRIKRKM
jgi:hypothetical protein